MAKKDLDNADNENDSKVDERNTLNDLSGKEWVKHTKSFYMSEKCAADADAFEHPAPFLIKDIEWLIEMFTKKGMTVLDPFAGSGTTAISSYLLGRYPICIDLNPSYYDLSKRRFDKLGMNDKDYLFLVGDSYEKLDEIGSIDYIVTSPPYHSILKNDSKGIRKDASPKGYRSGSRIGVEYYSNNPNDLGNQDTYEDFLNLFGKIMGKCFDKLNNHKYCSIVISDFTVDKNEVCVQADVLRIMEQVGFKFVGTIVLLQDHKPLYPFGYPYSFVINHMHQNVITFRKDV